MKVFLSGDTRTEWQSKIMERFPDHSFFDPRTVSEMSYEEMARIERKWIDECDILFAYLNETNPYGFGTCFEIGYAVAIKKLIIYVDEKQVSSSQWIAQHPVHAYTSFEEGLTKLSELLEKGNDLVAALIIKRLHEQDFSVLVERELDDDLASRVASQIYDEPQIYGPLMLAQKTMPRQWYDWNLGYLLQRLDSTHIIGILRQYSENFYQSEGIAWALGLLGRDDDAIIEFLQEQCRRCERYDAWWCAAQSLQQLNRGEALEILKRTLRGSEWQNVDYCLENLGSRPATIGLLRAVNQANLKKIIHSCLEGLKTLTGRKLHNVIWLLERFRQRDRNILRALMELHDGDVHYGSSVAHRVVEALGQIAHPDSRTLLEEHILSAGYFRTRALAAKGLASIGDYKSIEPIEKALEKEQDPHVLSALTSALYSIRDPEKRKDNELIAKAGWLENGMIIDETNKWYWSPEIYDNFSKAEDPESVAFDLALSLVVLNEPKKVLDLGAGTGRFIFEMYEKLPSLEHVIALDASREMIDFIKRRFHSGTPMVEPILGSIDQIPLDDESVDLVVSSWGFPSRIWDREQAYKELAEVNRVLKHKGVFLTIGWDEDFTDEMTEIWHKFVIEEEYYFDSLSEYRRRKRSKIASPRNCGLTSVKTRLQVPVKFYDRREAANVFGHLFGYSAGFWVLENAKYEFNMNVSITYDNKGSITNALSD